MCKGGIGNCYKAYIIRYRKKNVKSIWLRYGLDKKKIQRTYYYYTHREENCLYYMNVDIFKYNSL